MTGPSFSIRGVTPAEPTHDAVHFHDDDVSDVQWPETFRFDAPNDLPSGVYAMRLRGDGMEDHIPFLVVPPSGRPTAPLALLMPTFSYLAYATSCSTSRNPSVSLRGRTWASTRLDTLMSLRMV